MPFKGSNAVQGGGQRLLSAPALIKRTAPFCTLAAALVAIVGCGGSSDSAPAQAEQTTSVATQEETGAKEASPAPQPSTQGHDAESGDGRHGPPVPMPKGQREPRPTAKQRAEATRADIALTSPSLGAGSVPLLPVRFTCDGENTWPSLAWSGVPSGSVELALLLVNTQPVNGQVFFDWAVAGIDPSLTSLESDQLPAGAIVGRNSSGKNGYSLCPTHSGSETYFFTLYAIPKSLGMKPGFDPLALRTAALHASHDAGLLPVSYTR